MAKIGLLARLYHGTAGSTAATEVKNVIDLTLNDERSEADISTRAFDGELMIASLRKFSIDFGMPFDESDSDQAAIVTAYLTRAPIALKVISSTNGSGIDADFYITKAAQSQPLKEAIKIEFTAKPTYVTRYPAAITATS